MTTSPPSNAPPALWNPKAAVWLSLIFTPAFGAFLHARNADALGRTEEAKANRWWFYATLAYLGVASTSIFIPKIPDAVFRGAAIGILVGWYAMSGKAQIQHVKDTWQDRYQRKSWMRLLLIAFVCLVCFLVACVVLGMVADSLFGIDDQVA